MITSYRHAIIYIATLFVFAGCSYGISIEVEEMEPYQPVFRIEKPFFSTPLGKSVQVSSLSVYRMDEGKWDYENPLWRIGGTPGDEKTTNKIIYGKVPDGCEEGMAPKKLEDGIKYQVDIKSPGGFGGTVFKFITINGKRTIQIVDSKKK